MCHDIPFQAQFHSKHFESCVDFHIDLGGVDATGNSDCINVVINDGPMINEIISNDILDRYAKNTEQRSELDSNGYE